MGRHPSFRYLLILVLTFPLFSCTNHKSEVLYGLWKGNMDETKSNNFLKHDETKRFVNERLRHEYHFYDEDKDVFNYKPKTNENTLLRVLENNEEIPLEIDGNIFGYSYEVNKERGCCTITTKIKNMRRSLPVEDRIRMLNAQDCFIRELMAKENVSVYYCKIKGAD